MTREPRIRAKQQISKGVLSAGWNSVLTGSALLVVAYALGSVADDDSAAPFVAVVLGVAGVWLLVDGLRAEVQQRHKDR